MAKARRPDRRKRSSAPRYSVDLHRRALRIVVDEPLINSGDLGGKLFGDRCTPGSARKMARDLKAGLKARMLDLLRTRSEWTPDGLSQLVLVGEGPALGRKMADRVHRFMQLGADAGEAFNSHIQTPSTLNELRRAIWEYRHFMGRRVWGKPKAIHELSTHDLANAERVYIRALLEIPNSRRHVLSAEERTTLGIFREQPREALRRVGIDDVGMATRALRNVALVRRIEQHVRDVRRVNGCSPKEARGIILASMTREAPKVLRLGRERIWKEILLRADPKWSQQAHMDVLGMSQAGVQPHFKRLKAGLEASFGEVRGGRKSLPDVAQEYDIGVTGLRKLYRGYLTDGEVRLYGGKRRYHSKETPPIKREMLSSGDLLNELAGYHRLLSGSRSRKNKPPNGARVRRSGALNLVHRRVESLLEHVGEEGHPPINKIRLLRASIDSVGEGENKVIVTTRRGDRRTQRTTHMRLEGLRYLCAELEREALEHHR